MSAASSSERTILLDVEGATLHVVEVGAGEGALVALHGGPGEAHDCLRPHLDRLATPRRRVVYFDQRGGGRSRLHPGAPWATIAEHARDVDRVRENVGAEAIDLLGFSWGSRLAIDYAIERRDRVRSLVLVSPPPMGARDGRDAGERLARASARAEVTAFEASLAPLLRGDRGPEAARHARFAIAIAPFFSAPERALGVTPVDRSIEAAEAASRSARDLDLDRAARALSGLPVLVVRGEDDPLPPSIAEAIGAAAGGALVVIPGAGHAPFVEAIDAFTREVLAFLGDEHGAG